MERYDYRKNVLEDIEQWWEDHLDWIKEKCDGFQEGELAEWLFDEMLISDSVTGNASGSYTFNTWQAEENLCHNIYLLEEALSAFGHDIDFLKNGAEACDVMIRCYLLHECINEFLDNLDSLPWQNGDEQEDEC